jgi:hypothetical protein
VAAAADIGCRRLGAGRRAVGCARPGPAADAIDPRAGPLSLLTRAYVLTRLHARHRFAVLGVVGMLMAVTPWVGPLREQARELQAVLDAHAMLDPVGQAVLLQRGLLAHQPAARRVLRGESAVEPERAAHARAVDQRIATLTGALRTGHLGLALGESHALQADWQALVQAIMARTIDADGSDTAHRLLVEQTLQVIDFVAAAPTAPANDGAMATGLAGPVPPGPRPLLPALEAALARLAAGPGGHADAGPSLDLVEAHAIWRLVERQLPLTAPGHAAGDPAGHAAVDAARAEATRALAELFAARGQYPALGPSTAQTATVAWQHVERWHDAERDALASTLAAEAAHRQTGLRQTAAAGTIHALFWLAVVALLARRRCAPSAAPPSAPAAASDGPAPGSPGWADHVAAAQGVGGEHRALARRLVERLRRPAADREPAPPPG